ncbi:hypothetical protein [Candidatus Pantoea multigeneris]|uniref:Uncharacterized protein n=1 Tax=Candidatus Pantoea multigeneris TaxID=2608357 RepID=A0ABX0RA51_9GAMM|nr:hypothetical protein [Pantoea multigeneris]NIF22221.1 hypothetical protein [Pantoea multigeneris]
MTKRKMTLTAALLAAAALVAWWLVPHYSKEDEAYYVSVFCAIHHDDSSLFLKDMNTVIEGGNSDYALQKIHFIPSLGKKVVNSWSKLTPEQQLKAKNDNPACQQLMHQQLDR